MKGLPWLLPRDDNSSPYLNSPNRTSSAMDILHFSNENLTTEVFDGNTVSSRYKFSDFRGTVPEPARAEAIVQTRCQEVNVTSHDGVIPITARNSTANPLHEGSYRWIHVEVMNSTDPDREGNFVLRIELCMFGTGNVACCL